MPGNIYDKIYTIRVDETVSIGKWYYSRVGREFDCELVKYGADSYFKIDYLHKIPARYASIIRCREEVKYIVY